MPTIAEALQRASALTKVSDSARLDVELLLCHALQCSRSHLYTWPEKALTETQWQLFEALHKRRHAGEPMAYVLGQREFWSLTLSVNETTLIPRPATETLVAWVLDMAPAQTQFLLDLGTGTGAIALALASERPGWHLLGVDISAQAVALANQNAQALGIANCRFQQGSWFDGLDGQRFHMIVSNPPYIDANDPHLTQGDVRFEPRSALVAADRGLAAIAAIAHRASLHLTPKGWLCVEHGYDQAAEVQSIFRAAGFDQLGTRADLDGQPRITFGQYFPSE